MIIEQQVSVASAAAIWARTVDGLGGEVSPARVLALSPEALRAFGLSGPKVRYVREIAQAQADGRIDLDDLRGLSDTEALAALTAITGVGRWTAQTFLMFCEGRADLFPAGDIALQEAIRWADRRMERPDEKRAAARAEAWRPHRGVAAHLLWGWYGGVKRGEIRLDA
ncbi:DNA-3-methyladenine glycosylase family protein [Brevundimonas sp. VNH65]|uniref:DNA-3-methyladenine glycosylase family protein n=1 Tax=Brevundimonas sp. VNH65 TaxID=3400917 RepID=UPI003C0A8EA5